MNNDETLSSHSQGLLLTGPLDRRITDMVRLALVHEYRKQPIRREDIIKHVLPNHPRLVSSVVQAAKEHLNAIFGFDLVALPTNESRALGLDSIGTGTGLLQGTRSTISDAAGRRAAVGSLSRSLKAPSHNASTLRYIVVRMKEGIDDDSTLVGPSTRLCGLATDTTTDFDDTTYLRRSRSPEKLALLAIVLVLIYLNQGTLEHGELFDYLQELKIDVENDQLFGSVDILLTTWKKQKYLTVGKATTDNPTESRLYAIGPRAFMELPPQRLAAFVGDLAVYTGQGDGFYEKARKALMTVL